MPYLKRLFYVRIKATKSDKCSMSMILPGVVFLVMVLSLSYPLLAIADLTVTLNRSLILNPSDDFSLDQDHDALVDSLEGYLAYVFRPLFRFDSDEGARLPEEPVTVFQVHPMDISIGSTKHITIQWVFLFRNDGGYGPDSYCSDSHGGDNDTAVYELESDDGITWSVAQIHLSFKGLEWPANSDVELYSVSHPVVYMSAHKHHEYFNTNWNHDDSIYSDWDCNDDVNGLGDGVLADLESLEVEDYHFNNVGEHNGAAYNALPPRDNHNSLRFINDFSPFYVGHSAWGSNNFYEVGPTSGKWLDDFTYGIAYIDWRVSLPGFGLGNITLPFTSLAEGYNDADFKDGAWVNIYAGNYPEAITISKASHLRAIGGPVTIGE